MSDHPYVNIPEKAHWRKAIQGKHPLDVTDWYTKKFPIGKKSIATAGSCFAQHIGSALKHNGYNYVDVEPAPKFLARELWQDYGYGMYSARFGNIYTSRQLLQLVLRALGEFSPNENAWKKNGGFVDPFRPTIEPIPFSSIDELEILRNSHLSQVVKMFEMADLFVFTLGLTETWLSKSDGAAFPLCPGTAGGEFDAGRYNFLNLTYRDVITDMRLFFRKARDINPKLKFMLTVSPVPLMATATNQNVVVATMKSKSILRAAAGYLADSYQWVDYFPSFEIISSHVMRSQFYNPDMRTISSHGVRHVMKQFFKEHPILTTSVGNANSNDQDIDDALCDEEILSAFGE